jgi:DNA-binding NarL/FixJ family response regulator
MIKLAIFSGSSSFTRHVSAALGAQVQIHAAHASVRRLPGEVRACDLALIHSNSQRDCLPHLLELLDEQEIVAAIAADVPDLKEMLSLSQHHVRAYFNSYMADVHYQQMIAMVQAGQTWISPPLMAGALDLAKRAEFDSDADGLESVLEGLTNREREIACDVAAGKTNQEIADARQIAERTVKSHLTHIFSKLGTRNRHALTARIRGATSNRRSTDAASMSRLSH